MKENGIPTQPRRHLRWWLCGLLFCATALSFLDRQVLSVLAPVVTDQLGMDNVAYAHVTTAFLLSYAVMFLVGGRVMDLVGTRLGMALSVGLWSIASALHAAVRGAGQLGFCRFLLGVGEGGCFPGAAKGVAEWFPQRERAMAMGIAIGGASLGAVVAPPMTVWLSEVFGWRGVFLTTGLIGATWVIVWWAMSRNIAGAIPTAGDRGHRPPAGVNDPETSADRPPLLSLLGRLDVWGLAIVRFIVDPVFYFYMFWIPKYLSAERGISQQAIGALSWIPFLALGISNVAGGWVSDRMVRAGLSASAARKWIMAAAALLTVASSFAGRVAGLETALAMMSLLMFAHGFWVTNYVTLIGDRFPKGAVGTVMGFSGAVGAVGGMLANTAIGSVVDHFSYGPVWLVSGLMYPAAFVVLMMTVRRPT
ncbi:MAG TPA: MFS transporter [Verrucomicrobiae bacterium]|mgnify:CR=1 FL=1|nr:MFS transporter [Verrucomicrobiae bacterium]